jgi:hypothetical protein
MKPSLFIFLFAFVLAAESNASAFAAAQLFT